MAHCRRYFEKASLLEQYRLTVVIAFIKALLRGSLVEQAYLAAIDSPATEARHVWRWIKDLLKQLPLWRTVLAKPADTFAASGRSRTLALLLTTLDRVLHRLNPTNMPRSTNAPWICEARPFKCAMTETAVTA